MNSASVLKEPIRLVLCTCSGIYSDIVLLELVKSPHLKLVGIVDSTRILRKKGWNWWDIILLIRRTGLRYPIYLWVITSLYKLFRRPWHENLVEEYLQNNRIPILHTKDINSPDGTAFMQACTPDLMLSAYFNQLIGPELLTLPKNGCLNIHPGQLPYYKGVDPVIHAIARGEKQLGVTVHYQDQEFDTGPVLISGNIAVKEKDSLLSLNCRLFKLGIELLLNTIAMHGGLPPGAPQKSSSVYDSWPDTAIVAQIRKNGIKLIDIKSIRTLVSTGK